MQRDFLERTFDEFEPVRCARTRRSLALGKDGRRDKESYVVGGAVAGMIFSTARLISPRSNWNVKYPRRRRRWLSLRQIRPLRSAAAVSIIAVSIIG